MWLRVLLGTVLALKSTSALCEAFLVQTGEHGSFTRLVVSAEPDTTWSTQRNGSSVELRIPKHSDGFITSDAFKRISTQRIASIDASRDRLKIKIGCDCDIATFVDQDRHIVIDIGDKGQTLAGALLKDGEPSRDPATGPSAEPDFAWPLLGPKRDQQQTEFSFTSFQKQLALDIGRMVTLDILEDAPAKPKRKAAKSPQSPERDVETTKPLQLGPANQMILTDLSPALEITRPSGPGAYDCEEIDTLATSLTDQAATYEDYIAAQRAFSATQQDDDAQFNLIVKSLSLGFGTEARLSLSSLDHTDLQVQIATAVADITEVDQTNHMASLVEATTCNRDFIFWRFLGNDPKLETSKELNKEILRQFDRLSSPLRRLLGARLAKSFRIKGYPEAAFLAIGAIERAPEQPPTELVSERAANDLDKDKTSLPPNLGELLPEQVIATDAEVFVTELNARLANGLDITEGDSHLLDSFLFAETHEKTRLELLKAAFHVAEQLEQNQKSFDLLAEIQRIDRILAATLHDSFLKAKLKNSSDFDLIEVGLFSLQQFGDQIDPALRETLLSRMNDAGVSGDIVGKVQTNLSNQNPGENVQDRSGTGTVTAPADTLFQQDNYSLAENTTSSVAPTSVESVGQQNLSEIETILQEVEQTRTSLAQEMSAWAKEN